MTTTGQRERLNDRVVWDRHKDDWVYARRIEGCACGGLLVADPNDSRAVEATVKQHQRTYLHQDWRARMERS